MKKNNFFNAILIQNHNWNHSQNYIQNSRYACHLFRIFNYMILIFALLISANLCFARSVNGLAKGAQAQEDSGTDITIINASSEFITVSFPNQPIVGHVLFPGSPPYHIIRKDWSLPTLIAISDSSNILISYHQVCRFAVITYLLPYEVKVDEEYCDK